MITRLEIRGYRSIRHLVVLPGALNVVTGPNGCGKSNLYRSLQLLSAAAAGRLARTVLDEGGMPSLFWAGARTKKPVRVIFEVETADWDYRLALGLPPMAPGLPPHVPHNPFALDPEVKEERVRARGRRNVVFLDRKQALTQVRDAEGRRAEHAAPLEISESALPQLREPHAFPLLFLVGRALQDWRFYHHFRTDPGSPLREERPGVRTPVLDPEGNELAATLATLLIGPTADAVREAVASAFDGAELELSRGDQRFQVGLGVPDFQRPLLGPELSDGTVRYLALVAALSSPHPAPVLAFNEPETSLQPSLLEPLAELLVAASQTSQVWVATHSAHLVALLEEFAEIELIRLEKVRGETQRDLTSN